MFFPVAIIVIGGIFLLQNLGLISSNVWGIIWPALLIIAGASMIWKKGDCCCGWGCKCDEKK